VLLRQGREAEAIEELRIALEADPRHAGALMESARLAARHGELERAIGMWQRIVSAYPDTPVAEQAREAVAHASRLAAVLEAVDA
jgi:tetratricopeptide (TPR) repeat protein